MCFFSTLICLSEKFFVSITLIKSSLGRFIPIFIISLILDFKSGSLNLYWLIGFFEVINKNLLSCTAVFQREYKSFSEADLKDSLDKEVTYFKKKYKFEINLMTNNEMIIPEYKIELLNKKKKLVKKVEHIESSENYDNNNFKSGKQRFNFRRNKGRKNFKNKNFMKKGFNNRKKIGKIIREDRTSFK